MLEVKKLKIEIFYKFENLKVKDESWIATQMQTVWKVWVK